MSISTPSGPILRSLPSYSNPKNFSKRINSGRSKMIARQELCRLPARDSAGRHGRDLCGAVRSPSAAPGSDAATFRVDEPEPVLPEERGKAGLHHLPRSAPSTVTGGGGAVFPEQVPDLPYGNNLFPSARRKGGKNSVRRLRRLSYAEAAPQKDIPFLAHRSPHPRTSR